MTSQFSVSARGKPLHYPIDLFIDDEYSQYNVKDVFGFTEHTPMYGGRVWVDPDFSPTDINILYDKGLGLKLPLSNHYTTREDYEQSIPFLTKYHRKGNSVVLVKDQVVEWIREDFPLYSIEASVIKDLKTMEEIDNAVKLYDVVVLQGRWNLDDQLNHIKDKDKIRLFTTVGCALNCPAKICYPSMSKINRRMGGELKCSQPIIERKVDVTYFDIPTFEKQGFSKFKVVRKRQNNCY